MSSSLPTPTHDERRTAELTANLASRAERRRAEKALRKLPLSAISAAAAVLAAQPATLDVARRRLRAYVTPGTNMAELYGRDPETIARRFAADLSLVLEALDRLNPVR